MIFLYVLAIVAGFTTALASAVVVLCLAEQDFQPRRVSEPVAYGICVAVMILSLNVAITACVLFPDVH